jgi:Zn-dependent protease/CBS domain-containing protein
MRWSLKIGRFAGIDVYLHFTFVLLLAFIAFGQWRESRSLALAWMEVVILVAVFTCVLLHEFGHALAARQFGIKTRDITLLPIGGVARLERMPEKPLQELWVAVAGPLVNVVIATLLLALLGLQGQLKSLLRIPEALDNYVAMLCLWNLLMVAFNLLPAFPMDGGRVLRAFLAMKLNYATATRLAATVGQGMALVFALLGLMSLFRGTTLLMNPMMLFIALFVWIGASQEAEAAEMKSSLSGVTVSQAMLTQFNVLWPAQTLGEVAGLVLAGSQSDFPVVESDRVVGLLTRTDLIAGLSQHGSGAPVHAVMRRQFPELSPTDPLEIALQRERPPDLPILPVTQNGLLIGLLTIENVGEFLMIRSALNRPLRLAGKVPPPIPRATPPPLPPRINPA